MPTRPAQRTTPAAEQLVEMLAVRRQLSAEKTAAENASRLLEDLMLQRLSRRRIARLAADIELLDKRRVLNATPYLDAVQANGPFNGSPTVAVPCYAPRAPHRRASDNAVRHPAECASVPPDPTQLPAQNAYL
jgi:hypothetical protein